MHKNIFDDNYKKIVDSLENIRFSVDDFKQQQKIKISAAMVENPKIAKMIFENIGCGYSPSESIVITALHFETSIERVRAVYTAHKNATAPAVTFAKNYLIHTLKKRGFKIDDIAFILGVSRQTIFNYLKKDCLKA